MASIMKDTIKNLGQNKHAVGTLNNWGVDVINLGAKVVGEAIDNYTLVTLDFEAETGERTCTQATDATKKGYLIAGVEDYLGELETISAFYNGVGDRARIVKLVEGKRFECSCFAKADSAKVIKEGQVAHFDVASKKWLISNGTANHADYATALVKLVVVKADANSLDGQQLVRFEVQ